MQSAYRFCISSIHIEKYSDTPDHDCNLHNQLTYTLQPNLSDTLSPGMFNHKTGSSVEMRGLQLKSIIYTCIKGDRHRQGVLPLLHYGIGCLSGDLFSTANFMASEQP
jgi:hypothetical protein